MPRAFLIHWDEGEAKKHAWRVRRLGWSVRIGFREGGGAAREIVRSPPDAVLIYLSRLPSHGARVAEFLGEQEATRRIPIVFVDGKPDRAKKLAEQFPRAFFTTSSELGASLAALPKKVEPPGGGRSSAGYSGTPLARKLGIKPGHRVALVGAPGDFSETLGELPRDVEVRRDLRAKGPFDVIVCFVKRRAELERRLPVALERLETSGGLWIAWPKKASGERTDLSGGVVREFGLSAGVVDNKVCAIDETWSGQRFVVRRSDR